MQAWCACKRLGSSYVRSQTNHGQDGRGGRKAGVRDAMAGKIMHLKNSGPGHRALRNPLGQREQGNRAPWRPNVEPTWALGEGLTGKCTALEAPWGGSGFRGP